MLQDLGRQHGVERTVDEREPGGVAAQHADVGAGGDLAGLDHRVQRGLGAEHLVGGQVDGDDVVAAAGQLERVPAEPGADVEHEVTGPQAERGQAIRANGEHQRPFRRDLATLAGIASTSRYCSTVSSAHRRHVHRSSTRRRPAVPTLARSSASSRPRRDRRGQRAGVAGAARQHGLAVPAGHLGQRATVRGDQAVPVAIASIAGRLNPS